LGGGGASTAGTDEEEAPAEVDASAAAAAAAVDEPGDDGRSSGELIESGLIEAESSDDVRDRASWRTAREVGSL